MIFLASLGWPVLALAQMASLFGVGPVSGAMGGTSLQQGRPNPYQVFSSPAALGYLRNVEVGVSAQYFDPQLRPFGTLVLNSNGTRGNFSGAGVLSGGGQLLAMAFPIGNTRPLTLAGTLYLPFSTMLRISGSPVNYPYYPLYNDISRNFFFSMGLGFEPWDGWAVGANIRSTTKSTAIYSLRADSTVNYSASAVEAKGESRLSLQLLYDHERAHPEGTPFTLGFMYRAKSGLDTRLAVDVTAFVPVQGELNSLPAFSPAEWALMASGRVGPSLTLSADLAWVKWSAFKAPGGAGNINTYIIRGAPAAGFRDIWVPRIGAEWAARPMKNWLKKISYRVGYLWHPSPAPDQTADSNFVDNDRHGATAGLGAGLRNPWRDGSLVDLDFFFQYNRLNQRPVTKVSPTNVGAPGYTSGGHILLYGAGVSLRF